MKIGALLLGLILLNNGPSDAQCQDSGSRQFQEYWAERGFSVRGQISSSSVVAGVTVELVARDHSGSRCVTSAIDGSFEFFSVAPGLYELRIAGSDGRVAHQEQVTITGPNQLLSITLPTRGQSDRTAGSTVSIRQLQHRVPSQAQKECNRGQAAARNGDHQKALEHFQKAVSIDPEFADAYSHLGTAQASLGNLDDALEQFQKAVKLVPDHLSAVANLSLVFCKLKRYSEAEQTARRALKLDPTFSMMRYILALSLIMEAKHEAEALDNLERAASEIPKARLLAADIFAHSGRRQDAARQLEQYLRSLPERDPDRQAVEERLAELRQP
jgi:tetratricopeptide (TPR) repeat protein